VSADSGLVVVAAGSSLRMSGMDKVWADLGGHPVLWWSLARLSREVDGTVLVVQVERLDDARSLIGADFPEVQVVAGGSVRQKSVSRGLAALPSVRSVAVHDAARPFATAGLLREGFSFLHRTDGAVPVEPVKDTIKRVDGEGMVHETVSRESLRACQTPQIFRAVALRRAHRAAETSGVVATDDAALVESAGGTIGTFAGHWTNFKITTPDDLWLARLLLEHGRVGAA
jgi:2-C-methyl-D-erythritol 4-phosphate cytidylyltransferase